MTTIFFMKDPECNRRPRSCLFQALWQNSINNYQNL